MNQSKFLQGKRIAPTPITKDISLVQLIETTFQAYNAARLREGAQLFAERMLGDNVTVGLTLVGTAVNNKMSTIANSVSSGS